MCHLGHTTLQNPNYYINDWYIFASSSLVGSDLHNYYNKFSQSSKLYVSQFSYYNEIR